MQLDSLYELQFTSCLLKDSASFNPDSAEWQSLCFCVNNQKLSDFVKILELADQFKSDLFESSFSDGFRQKYFYRIVKSTKKMLVL